MIAGAPESDRYQCHRRHQRAMREGTKKEELWITIPRCTTSGHHIEKYVFSRKRRTLIKNSEHTQNFHGLRILCGQTFFVFFVPSIAFVSSMACIVSVLVSWLRHVFAYFVAIGTEFLVDISA